MHKLLKKLIAYTDAGTIIASVPDDVLFIIVGIAIGVDVIFVVIWVCIY